MAVDKGLYQAPVGMDEEGGVDDAIEIEIVDPEEVTVSAGGMSITFGEELEDEENQFDANIAELMDETDLEKLSSALISDIEEDAQSRAEWEKTCAEGMELLGLQYEERTEPWEGACGVTHPLITEAIVRFQSECIMETFPAKGPVQTKIVGKETREKIEASHRVREDMNYQLTEVMEEFRPEHERMLFSLSAMGSAFKKVYYDPNLGRQTSVFVAAQDVLIPYGTTDIFTCPRVTHQMAKTELDLKRLQASNFYIDYDLGEPTQEASDLEKAQDRETGMSAVNDKRYRLYESQVDLDLSEYGFKDDKGEEDRIALPYVVTIDKGTGKILAIRRNWDPEDTLSKKRQHFVHYQYIPGFGAYGFGMFHLIGSFAKSGTSLLRQLVDAGTLSNLPGGLKSRGLRIKGDDTPISPGEWRDVDLGSGNIRDSILPLPYKEPSQVLMALLGNIVEEGRRFAATADMKVSDMSANAPVGTTFALLERQLKVMSAVQARVHHSFKQELKMLKAIISDYADELYTYEPNSGTPRARQEDFAMVEVIPVSDPNAATMSQRVVQYQAVLQLAQMAPDIYDLPMLHRQMLDVLGIKNAEELVPLEDDFKPMNPISENMALINGKPVKAFLYQDHDAHIATHQAALQDPIIMQTIGQNPKAGMIMAAAQAHLAEHMAFKYRQMIEQQLGVALPPEDEELPPEMEIAMSSMMAKAAQQVLEKDQAMAAQQQAQQQAQDPVLQMQQQELQIKQMEVQIKQMKAQADAQQKQAELELANRKLAMEAADRADKMEIAEKRLAADAAAKADKIALDERKQTADEEFTEQELVLQAQRNGVMGRAQEQQILQEDRRMANEAIDRLVQDNQTNELGESRTKPTGE